MILTKAVGFFALWPTFTVRTAASCAISFVGVAEQRPDGEDVDPGLQQVRREGMAQAVEGEPGRDIGALGPRAGRRATAGAAAR